MNDEQIAQTAALLVRIRESELDGNTPIAWHDLNPLERALLTWHFELVHDIKGRLDA